MKPLKIKSRMKGGKLEFITPNKSKADIQGLADGTYMLTIEKWNQRTGAQNRWIHAILPDIVAALRDAGYDDVRTPEDAKLIIKSLFFKKQYTNGLETIDVIEGTSETDKLDFASKAEEIINWAFTYLGINVSPPNTQLNFSESFYQ